MGRSKTWLLLGALMVAGLPEAGRAQALRSALLEHLAGHWLLRGMIAGQPVVHDVQARWVLGHEYLEIHELARRNGAAGRPGYKAIIYLGFNPDLKRYVCLWLDSTSGNALVPTGLGLAEPEASQLRFVWRDGGGQPTLSNRFHYDATTDRWQWLIENIEHGKSTPFAELTLSRR
ncbi:hypothetical protein ACYJW8_10295 [Frateuria aurantia]